MSKWEDAAIYCENVYGTYVDWEERFFTCPECEEPIYEVDWDDKDFLDDNGKIICPVCENILTEE